MSVLRNERCWEVRQLAKVPAHETPTPRLEHIYLGLKVWLTNYHRFHKELPDAEQGWFRRAFAKLRNEVVEKEALVAAELEKRTDRTALSRYALDDRGGLPA